MAGSGGAAPSGVEGAEPLQGMGRVGAAGAKPTTATHNPAQPRHPAPTGGTLTRHIRTSSRTAPKGTPMPLEAGLLEILACPACHAPLKEQDAELTCTSQDCGLAYPVRDGIPVLLVDEARRPA